MARRALVTGASSGIGREIVRQIAKGGLDLVLVARRQDELEKLAREVRDQYGVTAQVMPCDLSDPEARQRLIEGLAGTEIDTLVLCAGFGDTRRYDRVGWSKIDRMLQVNVVSTMQLTHALLPGMIERAFGRVIVIGSGAGHTATRNFTTYATTKWAVHGFCESLRLDVAGTGVTVTEVAPGPVPTGFDTATDGDAPDVGLPAFMVISAEQCAIESVRGMEQAKPIVYPGGAYGAMMRSLDVLPRPLTRFMFRTRAGR